jgi:FtsP/CotA-like multicopper oxidase with cupredoxin domain
MHKHYNKFWMIGRGTGSFTWGSVEEAIAAQPDSFNLDNAPFRDGFNTPDSDDSGSWMVLRYTITNAGPDVFHCHISQHITGGMVYGMFSRDNAVHLLNESFIVILSGMETLDVPAEYGPH